MRKWKWMVLAGLLAVMMCAYPAYADESKGVQDPQPELGAYFEIATNGWINGKNLTGTMVAYEIHSPVIVCAQLQAQAYGTAYNAAGSGVGFYDSGLVYHANAYSAGAVGYGQCPNQTPVYMHACSKLIHVGYNTFDRGPYVIYP